MVEIFLGFWAVRDLKESLFFFYRYFFKFCIICLFYYFIFII